MLFTNYKASLFKTFLGDGLSKGISITYYEETIPLGTAGPLRTIRDQIQEPIFVLNGDIISNVDLNQIKHFHEETRSDITIVTKKIETQIPFGVIEQENNKVTNWVEKPNIKSYISAGIYLISPRILDLIPENCPYNMDELVRDAIKRDLHVNSFLYGGEWIHISQTKDYEKLMSYFSEKK